MTETESSTAYVPLDDDAPLDDDDKEVVPSKRVLIHEIVKAALQGDAGLAHKMNEPLTLLHEKLFVESNPIPAKWAAQRIGLIDTAYCRPPLDVMDPQYVKVIEDALAKAQLL